MVCEINFRYLNRINKNSMIKKTMIGLSLALFISACSGEKVEEKKNDTMDFSDITKNLAGSKEAKEAKYAFLKANIIIILAEELKGDSTNIKVQDYKDDKGSFIPVFTSKEKYKESSQGQPLGKGIVEINAMFMLSIMNDTDRIRLNPGLSDEAYFEVKDLKKEFENEIKALKH